MWNALILSGWFLLLIAPPAAVFGLAVPKARHGARARRLALICAALVLVYVAVHRALDIFVGPIIFSLFLDAFNVDLDYVTVIPGVGRAYQQAWQGAIATTQWAMVPVTAVVFCGFWAFLRIPSMSRWLYDSPAAK